MLSKRTAFLAFFAFTACANLGDLGGEPAAPKVSVDPRLQPRLGAVVTQPDAPPPISGGTLALSRREEIAVAADPDRDRVYVVDLAMLSVRHTVQLARGAEPGRVALDRHGRAHVALRGSNELATIELATGAVTTRSACVAPRGVAHDPATNSVFVVCASGDIAVFAAAGGPRTELRSRVGDDLRDVLVHDHELHVTEFRRARVRRLTRDGAETAADDLFGSSVAWRATRFDPDDALSPDVIVTQEVNGDVPVSTGEGGYGSGASGLCFEPTGIVSTRVWIKGCEDGTDAPECAASFPLPNAVLPVDVAANGREVAVVAAGNAFADGLPQIFVVSGDRINSGRGNCVGAVHGDVPGQATALGFDALDRLIVQTREPAQLHVMTDDRQRAVKTIALAPESRADTGHDVFHANAGGQIACASCHPEGGEDGRVWDFEGIGRRRTPSLRGTTLHTEPFHWDGDMKDVGAIVEHVFQKRMSGPKLTAEQSSALARYMFALPPPPPLRAAASAPLRGGQLFAERCASCHAGALSTNNETVDVGTRGRFQVPSLVGVAWRGPWLHDGCAHTLYERFDPACGGATHGDLAGLDRGQLVDIVAFMETL